MKVEIVKYNNLSSLEDKVIPSIKEIFFLSSSKKEFRDQEHKEAFFNRWCGGYLTHYPDWFYLLMVEEEILGYLAGAIDSHEVVEKLKVPGLEVFLDLYDLYPAHLHINFHPKSRGLGLGSLLVNNFINEIKNISPGCHLITSPNERNVEFYRRLGFVDEFTRKKGDYPLLFLGKKLSSSLG